MGEAVAVNSEDYIGYPALATRAGQALLAFAAYPSAGADEIRCVSFDTAANSLDVVITVAEGVMPAMAANTVARNYGIAYSEDNEYPRMLVYPESSSKKGCAATASGSPTLFGLLAVFAASVLLLRRRAAC